MSAHVPGFQPFSAILHHFVLAKLATSSIRVNGNNDSHCWYIGGKAVLQSKEERRLLLGKRLQQE